MVTMVTLRRFLINLQLAFYIAHPIDQLPAQSNRIDKMSSSIYLFKVIDFVLVSLLLTLNIFHTMF